MESLNNKIDSNIFIFKLNNNGKIENRECHIDQLPAGGLMFSDLRKRIAQGKCEDRRSRTFDVIVNASTKVFDLIMKSYQEKDVIPVIKQLKEDPTSSVTFFDEIEIATGYMIGTEYRSDIIANALIRTLSAEYFTLDRIVKGLNEYLGENLEYTPTKRDLQYIYKKQEAPTLYQEMVKVLMEVPFSDENINKADRVVEILKKNADTANDLFIKWVQSDLNKNELNKKLYSPDFATFLKRYYYVSKEPNYKLPWVTCPTHTFSQGGLVKESIFLTFPRSNLFKPCPQSYQFTHDEPAQKPNSSFKVPIDELYQHTLDINEEEKRNLLTNLASDSIAAKGKFQLPITDSKSPSYVSGVDLLNNALKELKLIKYETSLNAIEICDILKQMDSSKIKELFTHFVKKTVPFAIMVARVKQIEDIKNEDRGGHIIAFQAEFFTASDIAELQDAVRGNKNRIYLLLEGTIPEEALINILPNIVLINGPLAKIGEVFKETGIYGLNDPLKFVGPYTQNVVEELEKREVRYHIDSQYRNQSFMGWPTFLELGEMQIKASQRNYVVVKSGYLQGLDENDLFAVYNTTNLDIPCGLARIKKLNANEALLKVVAGEFRGALCSDTRIFLVPSETIKTENGSPYDELRDYLKEKSSQSKFIAQKGNSFSVDKLKAAIESIEQEEQLK